MTSFKADEAYVPPSNVKKKFAHPVVLSAGSYREMFTVKRMRWAFAASVFSLLLVNAVIVVLSDIHHQVFVLSLISLLCFVWVQKQFITISRGLNFKETYEDLKEKMPDGWFPDPWAYGVTGQVRLFKSGVWTDDVKIVDVYYLNDDNDTEVVSLSRS